MKTEALVGTVFKILMTNFAERVPDLLIMLVRCCPGGSFSQGASQAISWRTPTPPPTPTLSPSDRAKSDRHLSTFVALSPQYRLNNQAGTAVGGAQEERWDEVTLNPGEALSSQHHSHHPPPPAKKCREPSSRSGRPTKSMLSCPPTPHTLTRPLTHS